MYYGLLSEANEEVAVKWFSRESLKGEYDFLAELTIINRLRHKHLVRLLGEFLCVAYVFIKSYYSYLPTPIKTGLRKCLTNECILFNKQTFDPNNIFEICNGIYSSC